MGKPGNDRIHIGYDGHDGRCDIPKLVLKTIIKRSDCYEKCTTDQNRNRRSKP